MKYTSYLFATVDGEATDSEHLRVLGAFMSGSGGTAPMGRLAAVRSQSGGIAISAADENIDLLMGSFYFAWEMSTPEEAQLALRWAGRMVGQSGLVFADLDEAAYVLGGQYLQALISARRRGTPTA